MSNRLSDKGSNAGEASDKKKVEFWNTLPGILTGFAGVITAIGALILALKQPNPLRQGSFSVNARYDYEFKNPSQEAKTVLFESSGTWSAVSEKYNPPSGETSPQGYADRPCNNSCRCPEYVIGALVGEGDQGCFLIGEEKRVTLAGAQSIRLFMNDFKGERNDGERFDKDNEGKIKVEWSFAE